MAKQPTKLDVQQEAISRLARGDSYKAIAKDLKVSEATISKLKKENTELIENAGKLIIAKKIAGAIEILDQTHKLIQEKLDQAQQANEREAQLWQMFLDRKITYLDYTREVRALPAISLNDLTSLSREMFHQSQLEQGKPTQVVANTQEAKENLMKLTKALGKGDEVELQRIIFNPQEAPKS